MVVIQLLLCLSFHDVFVCFLMGFLSQRECGGQHCVECFLVEQILNLISIISCTQTVLDVSRKNRLSIIHQQE